MINWYYVHGTERVGPVDADTLKNLFLKEEINLDSYVWRKGFQNWERLKDVSELDFSTPQEVARPIVERRADVKAAEKAKEQKEEIAKGAASSPEINFSFDWKTIREKEELFFIKVGHDRKAQLESELFGPYSLDELRDAINDKRINNRTLIFAPGMPGWVEVGDTPLDPKNLKVNTDNLIDETPLLMVVENDPLPIITLVEKAGIKECTLLGAGHFEAGKVVMGSIYSGTALKAKNVKLKIEEYRPREQKVLCRVEDISESAKKIMRNYAD